MREAAVVVGITLFMGWGSTPSAERRRRISESIANMLGVRREGVTEAALKLQKAGLIRNARGRISVLDRPGLEKRACECYAVVKKEYRLLRPRARRSDCVR